MKLSEMSGDELLSLLEEKRRKEREAQQHKSAAYNRNNREDAFMWRKQELALGQVIVQIEKALERKKIPHP